MNTNQTHFNDVYTARTRYGRRFLNRTLTLVTDFSITDTSANARSNLGRQDVELSNPEAQPTCPESAEP